MALQQVAPFRNLASLFQSRLSWRIGSWIFLSIAAIGTVLVLPTVEDRRQELLDQVEEVSDGKIRWILETYPDATGEELFGHVQQLYGSPMLEVIIGGTVYEPDGSSIGTFGEPPELSLEKAQAGAGTYHPGTENARYDAAWAVNLPDGEHVIVIRHNASTVRSDLYTFILRQGALMLMISAFVTLVMMVVLWPQLIHPILTLRQDLAKAGTSVCSDDFEAEFASSNIHRQDELGEVIATFREMYQQICQAVSERKRVESALRQHNLQMQDYLGEVDHLTQAAADLETGAISPEGLNHVAARDDELGKLARVLQQAAREVKQRETALKRQLEELQIEIDQAKRQQEVTQITRSGYFQDIQKEVASVDLDTFWE